MIVIINFYNPFQPLLTEIKKKLEKPLKEVYLICNNTINHINLRDYLILIVK